MARKKKNHKNFLLPMGWGILLAVLLLLLFNLENFGQLISRTFSTGGVVLSVMVNNPLVPGNPPPSTTTPPNPAYNVYGGSGGFRSGSPGQFGNQVGQGPKGPGTRGTGAVPKGQGAPTKGAALSKGPGVPTNGAASQNAFPNGGDKGGGKNGAVQAVQGVGQAVTQAVGGASKATINAVSNAAKAVGGAISNVAGGTARTVVGSVTQGVKAASKSVSKAATSAKSAASKVTSAIKSLFGSRSPGPQQIGVPGIKQGQPTSKSSKSLLGASPALNSFKLPWSE